MSSKCSVAIVRCEKHAVRDGVLYGTGGFPSVLTALSSSYEAMTIVVPIVNEGTEFDRVSVSSSGERTGYLLRPADRLVPMPDVTGYLRAFWRSGLIIKAIASARRRAAEVLIRVPEHTSWIVVPLARMLWSKRAVWIVGERLPMPVRGSVRNILRALLNNVLQRVEAQAIAGWSVVANGSRLAGLARDTHCNPRVVQTISTTLTEEQVEHLVSQRIKGKASRAKRGHWTILFVGRVTDEKGLEVLIEAAARAQPHLCKDVRVRIVGWGDPGYISSLRDLAARVGLSGGVEFAGPLPFGSRLFEEYTAADLFVIPSVKPEGTPRTLSEAVAIGLPALASDQAGMRDILSRGLTDFLVTPADVSSLDRALRQILSTTEAYMAAESRFEKNLPGHSVGRTAADIVSALRAA